MKRGPLLGHSGWLGSITGQPSFFPAIIGALISAYGFGSSFLYSSASVLLCAVLLTRLYKEREYRKFVCVFAFYVTSFFFPQILRATSLICAMLMLAGFSQIGIAILVPSILPTLSSFLIGEGSIVLLSPCCLIALYFVVLIILHVLGASTRSKLRVIVCMLYAASLLFWTFNSLHLSACCQDCVPYGYRIGDALKKIIPNIVSNDGQLYYANASVTSVTNTGTVYLDHDSKTSYDGGTFSQCSPWSWNEIIAAEPFRIAAASDGVLVLNLGSELIPNGLSPLWGMSNGIRVKLLGAKHGGQLVVGDSDCFGNMLAPYQVNFLRRICCCDYRLKIWLCAIAALLVIGCFENFQMVASVSFIIIVFSIIGVFAPEVNAGGVRYVGKRILYPHTTLGYGVVRAAQKSGLNVLFTENSANILVVAAGEKAQYEAEKIVILEPNAEVTIGNDMFIADSVPLGAVGNVLDARAILRKSDGSRFSGSYTNEHVRVFATGSPALVMEEVKL